MSNMVLEEWSHVCEANDCMILQELDRLDVDAARETAWWNSVTDIHHPAMLTQV